MKNNKTQSNSGIQEENAPIREKFRQMEKELTKGLIKWKLKRNGSPHFNEEVLDRSSDKIVNEAHTIIKRRAKSTLKGIRQAKQEFLKTYRNKDDK